VCGASAHHRTIISYLLPKEYQHPISGPIQKKSHSKPGGLNEGYRMPLPLCSNEPSAYLHNARCRLTMRRLASSCSDRMGCPVADDVSRRLTAPLHQQSPTVFSCRGHSAQVLLRVPVAVGHSRLLYQRRQGTPGRCWRLLPRDLLLKIRIGQTP